MLQWALVPLALLAVGEVPEGSAAQTVTVERVSLKVHTYRPTEYRDGPLIMVFHGVLRNAAEYRDHARVLGDRFGAIVAAPEFGAEEFPYERYQLGGLIVDGKVQPPENRTWRLIRPIADQLRRQLKRPEMPLHLIGHSGGGQFLIRLAGFTDTGAKRIVVANAGTLLFPAADQDYPYGFGGLPEALRSDDVLQAYLAQPITVYLGTRDTERDEYFPKSDAAEKQGPTRLERGRRAFEAGRRLAEEQGWEFGWQLVEAEGVGHDHEQMFANERVAEALGVGRSLKAVRDR